MRSEIRGSDVFSQTFHLVGKMLERLIFLHGGSTCQIRSTLSIRRRSGLGLVKNSRHNRHQHYKKLSYVVKKL
jgi:hypothetical protein